MSEPGLDAPLGAPAPLEGGEGLDPDGVSDPAASAAPPGPSGVATPAEPVASPPIGSTEDAPLDPLASAPVGSDEDPPVDPLASVPPDPADVGLDTADASLLRLVDRLAGVLDRSDLLELEVEAGSTALILRRPEALAQVVTVGATGNPGTGAAPAQPAPGGHGQTAEIERRAVRAPLTGIWYAAPSPGSAPFVQAGGEVGVGQVIGLIEAMKLFNEIKSDVAGRVVRVAVESGQLVKAKQPLIEVEPL